jgi:hypothetical protein
VGFGYFLENAYVVQQQDLEGKNLREIAGSRIPFKVSKSIADDSAKWALHNPSWYYLAVLALCGCVG